MVQKLQKLNRVAQKKRVVIARGVLSVTVISAEDLPPADLMGKANPFVILTLKKSGTKNKSRVVNDSLNSVWNQSFDFIVEDGLHEMLIVEVWDHDTFGKHIRTRMHPPLPLPCQLQLISLLCHLYFFPALALSRMSRQYKSIKEITIGTRGWTCKVLVAEKAMPRTSRNSPIRYQRLILIDHEGTRIQATIFADAIELFENTLKMFKSYYISNAYIRPINKEHKIVDNELQWTINNYTIIEEVFPTEGEKQNCSMYKYNFHQLDDLGKYINSDAQLDIVALVLSILPIRTIKTRYGPTKIQELVIIDQKLKPQVLTMWDQFVDNECAAIADVNENKPIIIGTRLKVSTYNGLSFSTKLSSSFIINPLHIPEALELHKWSIENESCLKNIRSEKSYFTVQFGLTMPNDKEIVTIDAIQKLPGEQTNFWLKASISITNTNQRFWYMACEKCHKTTTCSYNDTFSCYQCRRTSKATPRCRFDAQLTDKTGSLVASLFAENAEKFLNCSAKQLMENNPNRNNMKSLASFRSDKEFKIYIKTNKNEYNGGTQFKYNVVSFFHLSQESAIKAAANVFFDKEGDTSTHVGCSGASIGNV